MKFLDHQMSNNINEEFLNALNHQQNGDFKKAELLYKNILLKNPNNINTLHQLAILAIQNQKSQIAIKLLNKVINLDPKLYLAYNNRGIAFRNVNNNNFAIKDFIKVISIKPDYPEAFFNLAITYTSLGKMKKALFYCKKAIQLRKSYAEAFNVQGVIYTQSGQFEKSITSFENAIKLKQNYFEAYNNKGNSLFKINNFKLALKNYNKAIEIYPKYLEGYINLSKLFLNRNDYDLALKNCEIAITINNKFENAYVLKGIILLKMDKPYKAIINYKECLSINPQNSFCLNGIGNAYMRLKMTETALNFFQAATSINKKSSDAHANLGLAYYHLRKYEKALKHLKMSLLINSNSPETLINLANTYLHMDRKKDALFNINKAIEINPNYTEAYNNKGLVFSSLKRYNEAIFAYKKALNLKPNFDLLLGSYIYTKLQICEWSNYTSDYNKYKNYLKDKSYTHAPFTSLNFLNNPEDQKLIAERFVKKYYPELEIQQKIKTKIKKEKIVLGYFSHDFGEHPVTRLINEIIENHDRSEFDVIGIYYGPPKSDEMYNKISKTFDKFIDVQNKSDEAISMICRDLKIDIAIDLTGHTKGSRIGIFSRKPAPVQVNFLGYPGTSGAKYINYIIADRTVIPTKNQKYFTEKIIYLPNSYLPTPSINKIFSGKYSKRDFNLPKKEFIFCCFNNAYKISPDIFTCWIKILKKVKGSVLWLSSMNLPAKQNLCKKAEIMGVSKERLIFAKRMENHIDHLSRLSLADLFLDTYPYNAHSTAIDFLSAGVPIITLQGESFTSRVVSSLLNVLDLNDLITNSYNSYEDKAIKIAMNKDEMNFIKNKLTQEKIKKIFLILLYLLVILKRHIPRFSRTT